MSRISLAGLLNGGKLRFTFALFMYATIIVDFIRKSIAVGWLPDGIPVTLIRNVLYVFCFFMVVLDIVKKSRVPMMAGFFVVAAAIVGVSWLIAPSARPLVPDTVLMFVSRLFPAFYLFYNKEDWEDRIKAVVNGRIILYVYFLMAVIHYETLSGGYMEFAYNLLCPTLIVTYYAIRNKKKLMAVGMIVVDVFMAIFGSRGVIFCILLSALCYFVMTFYRMGKRQKATAIVVLVVLALVLILSYTSLIGFISERFSYTRTVQQIAEGTFFSDRSASARLDMYKVCWNVIKEHPLAVRGILSDRIVLSNTFALEITAGYYAHNFVIEILYQFGFLVGGAVLVWFIVSICRSFIEVKNGKNDNWAIIYSACAASVVPFMMFSGSYLTEAAQWFVFGLIAVFAAKKGKKEHVGQNRLRV